MAKGVIGLAGVGFAVLAGATVLLGSWYTVDEGERAVVLRNGAVVGTAEPGLHFKTPIIEDAVKISVQSQSRLYESVAAYSRDQQPATMVVSVNFRLPPDMVENIYSNYGGMDGVVSRLIDRKLYEHVKNVFGQFNAVTSIQDRTRLNAEIQTAVQEAVTGPVLIESVQIENIDFSDAYENSIEQRMLAEVEVQKLQQNAEREKVQAQITVTQANAAADAVRAQAQAEADAISLRGEAEANAIRAKGAALRDNPALVSLVQAERWNGALPTTMVPNATVPFMSMDR